MIVIVIKNRVRKCNQISVLSHQNITNRGGISYE